MLNSLCQPQCTIPFVVPSDIAQSREQLNCLQGSVPVGALVGNVDGAPVGISDGKVVGNEDGLYVTGEFVGTKLGFIVGFIVGSEIDGGVVGDPV